VKVRVAAPVFKVCSACGEPAASNAELARKLTELERKLKGHDEAITAILSAIRELMNPPAPKRRGIGFTADLEPTK
jgi:hypothetical protein